MEIYHNAITGSEGSIDHHTPYGTLVAFYRGFNTGSLSQVAENWLHSQDAAMDNPLGGILRGWAQISGLYERVFSGPAEVYVEFYDYSVHQQQDTFYAVGRERGEFRKGDNERIALEIRTSRIFRRVDGAWKQVHHHGSIEDPALLERYQKAVFG